jgi:hypothetical protein
MKIDLHNNSLEEAKEEIHSNHFLTDTAKLGHIITRRP